MCIFVIGEKVRMKHDKIRQIIEWTEGDVFWCFKSILPGKNKSSKKHSMNLLNHMENKTPTGFKKLREQDAYDA